MSARLALFCCRNFAAEVGAGVTAEAWDDVQVVAYPARCGRPPLTADEVRSLWPAECAAGVLFGHACLGALEAQWAAATGLPPLRVVRTGQCFHLVANAALVDEAIAAGSYLATPGWLADWRGQLQALGFAPHAAAELFREFARELLVLDTGVVADLQQPLAEVQATLGLPVRRVAVGLDCVRARLVRQVFAWRLEQAQQAAALSARQQTHALADHVAAMDLLTRLAQPQDEAAVIERIEEVFTLLFAPTQLLTLRVDNAVVLPRAAPAVSPAGGTDLEAQLLALDGDYAWTADGAGFLLRIRHGESTLALLAADRLAFPAARERYLNMALAMSGVCGLAIDNARNRRRLLEAEKMASLGIVVAGVAHEINTPLGVGLAAASTLRQQTQEIAARFAARSMTHSDLDGFLRRSSEAARLIGGNLERIGQLTDAFRQVAVGGRVPDKRRFSLRQCLEQVIASLGERMVDRQVEVAIDCDPALEIDSVAGDWTSIFINLIGNSLKHGFKGRARGHIAVNVVANARQVHVDYRDDGIGMAAETVARVFDPFFTTDMQHGMGLGMHLVYNLVTHRLGGSIRCDSAPGVGVHFSLDVPR